MPFLAEAGEADCFENTISGYKRNEKWYSFVAYTFSICLAVVWLLGYAIPQTNSYGSNLLLCITQCFSLQASANSNSQRVFVAHMSHTKEYSSLCCTCHNLELTWIKQCRGNQTCGVILIIRQGKHLKYCRWLEQNWIQFLRCRDKLCNSVSTVLSSFSIHYLSKCHPCDC